MELPMPNWVTQRVNYIGERKNQHRLRNNIFDRVTMTIVESYPRETEVSMAPIDEVHEDASSTDEGNIEESEERRVSDEIGDMSGGVSDSEIDHTLKSSMLPPGTEPPTSDSSVEVSN